jgi:hypothetical protein
VEKMAAIIKAEKNLANCGGDFLEANTLVDDAKDDLRHFEKELIVRDDIQRFTCVRCCHECFATELLDGEACPSCKLI